VRPTYREIVGRLRTDGFARVNLTESTRASVQEVMDLALGFFRSPQAQKLVAILPNECGYRQMGIEYSLRPEVPDRVESFSFSPRAVASATLLTSSPAKDLFERMTQAFDELEAVAEQVTCELCSDITRSPCGMRFGGAFHDWSRLQINYSRPAELRDGLIHETHEDGTLLTLAFANGPGLEIRSTDDKFVPMTTSQNDALVMPGEILSLLSGGDIQPLQHRVIPGGQQSERLALLFFGDIDPARCQPWVTNDSNAGIDIGNRVRESVTRFGLKGFEAEQIKSRSAPPS
jgi:isopenicillin N synthase-like dioxygenase